MACINLADGSGHSLFAVREIDCETPLNPAFDTIRNNGTTLGLTRDSLQSEEIRSDRQIADFRLGIGQVGGAIPFTLSYGSFDQFLESALASEPWASPADTGLFTIDATATGYERPTGDFLADGFAAGQIITVTGFTGLGANGRMTITAVDELTMTTTPLDEQVQGAEAGVSNEQIVASESISAGQTRSSYTIVRHFSDILPIDKPYYIYRGVEVNSAQLTIAPNAMITGSFDLVGLSHDVEIDLSGMGAPTFNPPSATGSLDSFTGQLLEGGVLIGIVTEISLTMQNGIEPRQVVFSKSAISPSIGLSNLTGQMTVYFGSSLMVEKFLNETESSLIFDLYDKDNNIQRYTIPRIVYTGGQPDVSGPGPITLSMPFQALLDDGAGTNMTIERTPGV